MKSIKGLSFYNSEGSLIDVEELYAQVQQLQQDSAAKIIIGETASTTSTTSSDIDELAGTETDISLTNADDFKAGDMGISIVTVTDRNNSHGFMVFSALADEPDQPAGTLHVRFITGIYNGKDGTDGVSATIQIGEVTTGAAGTQASVTNSGTENAAVLDMTIPRGADGASGVTDVTAGTPTEQNGYTVTPVTFNFEQGNSKTVNIQAKNGDGAGVQQNAIINRTANLPAASTSSPDFVESGGDLWVKKTEYIAAAKDLQTSLPFGHEYGSAVTLLNGKIYLIGGGSRDVEGRDAIVEFNPDTKVATVLEATLSERWYSTAAASQGKIYVFGGSVSGSLTADIIEFDPLTQTVTTLEVTLPSARTGASAATASNGVIYVFGGDIGPDSGKRYLDEIIRFDPVNKTVTTLDATLPNAIRDAAIASANNGREFYMFGGVSSVGGVLGSSTADIIRFDTVTQTATTLKTTLPSPRNGSSAATAPNGNGKIYVFGGLYGSYIDDIVEFDPVNKTVTTLDATLPSGRAFAPAATASNGMIYVFGGVQGGGKPDFDDIVEFDIYANSTFAYRKIIIANSSGTVAAPSFNATT